MIQELTMTEEAEESKDDEHVPHAFYTCILYLNCFSLKAARPSGTMLGATHHSQQDRSCQGARKLQWGGGVVVL